MLKSPFLFPIVKEEKSEIKMQYGLIERTLKPNGGSPRLWHPLCYLLLV